MSLIQSLPSGPLDIVGDIHGEFEALSHLLQHLGYDAEGRHPDNRHLVFVGDFCDRGPDSPAVIALVHRLVGAGRAVAVLGNHEIDLMREIPVEGSGWFFDESLWNDQLKYAPFQRSTAASRSQILTFLATLPVALERDDLRVIHAAWDSALVNAVRDLPLGSVRQNFEAWEKKVERYIAETQLYRRMRIELEHWGHRLDNPHQPPPLLHAHGESEADLQMMNPLRILTQGGTLRAKAPIYSRGRWRFAHRADWWDSYNEAVPVVFGHFWRSPRSGDSRTFGKASPDLFAAIEPQQWHGARGNVFCVDFSVGGRWAERRFDVPLGQECKLAALRWPERRLCFDDGTVLDTLGFGRPADPATTPSTATAA